MDLGTEFGAAIYVFWGGREGTETNAAKDPRDALRWFRDALNFLCEYSQAQGDGYRFALEPKPNEPRGDIYCFYCFVGGAYLVQVATRGE